MPVLKPPLQILVLSDGKAGHENQSLGLAEAMARHVSSEIHMLRLDMGKGMIARVRRALDESKKFAAPDFVISAGHATHLPLLAVARSLGAKSVVLMKPGLPMGLFDWVIAPEHDFTKPPHKPRLITSKGALNRVVPNEGARAGKLLLIGGSSRIHGFDERALLGQIGERVGDGEGWQLTNSRRTPEAFLKALARDYPELELFPHEKTPSGWLAERLAKAEEAWVTEDSVSMVYEALTGGGKVGLLRMPRFNAKARVIRGLDALEKEGYFVGSEIGSPPGLAEADRCAAIILDAEN